MSHNESNKLIQLLNLQPHPEGGFYSRTYESNDYITSTDISRYQGEVRRACTSIYYLLNGNDFSAWHRLHSDEVWHYYKGSTVTIYMINDKGVLTRQKLGDPTQEPDAVFQYCIPANTWFAADIIDKSSFCLVGCTVSPGFEFDDFTLAKRDKLIEQFPEHNHIITTFTRI